MRTARLLLLAFLSFFSSLFSTPQPLSSTKIAEICGKLARGELQGQPSLNALGQQQGNSPAWQEVSPSDEIYVHGFLRPTASNACTLSFRFKENTMYHQIGIYQRSVYISSMEGIYNLYYKSYSVSTDQVTQNQWAYLFLRYDSQNGIIEGKIFGANGMQRSFFTINSSTRASAWGGSGGTIPMTNKQINAFSSTQSAQFKQEEYRIERPFGAASTAFFAAAEQFAAEIPVMSDSDILAMTAASLRTQLNADNVIAQLTSAGQIDEAEKVNTRINELDALVTQYRLLPSIRLTAQNLRISLSEQTADQLATLNAVTALDSANLAPQLPTDEQRALLNTLVTDTEQVIRGYQSFTAEEQTILAELPTLTSPQLTALTDNILKQRLAYDALAQLLTADEVAALDQRVTILQDTRTAYQQSTPPVPSEETGPHFPSSEEIRETCRQLAAGEQASQPSNNASSWQWQEIADTTSVTLCGYIKPITGNLVNMSVRFNGAAPGEPSILSVIPVSQEIQLHGHNESSRVIKTGVYSYRVPETLFVKNNWHYFILTVDNTLTFTLAVYQSDGTLRQEVSSQTLPLSERTGSLPRSGNTINGFSTQQFSIFQQPTHDIGLPKLPSGGLVTLPTGGTWSPWRQLSAPMGRRSVLRFFATPGTDGFAIKLQQVNGVDASGSLVLSFAHDRVRAEFFDKVGGQYLSDGQQDHRYHEVFTDHIGRTALTWYEIFLDGANIDIRFTRLHPDGTTLATGSLFTAESMFSYGADTSTENYEPLSSSTTDSDAERIYSTYQMTSLGSVATAVSNEMVGIYPPRGPSVTQYLDTEHLLTAFNTAADRLAQIIPSLGKEALVLLTEAKIMTDLKVTSLLSVTNTEERLALTSRVTELAQLALTIVNTNAVTAFTTAATELRESIADMTIAALTEQTVEKTNTDLGVANLPPTLTAAQQEQVTTTVNEINNAISDRQAAIATARTTLTTFIDTYQPHIAQAENAATVAGLPAPIAQSEVDAVVANLNAANVTAADLELENPVTIQEQVAQARTARRNTLEQTARTLITALEEERDDLSASIDNMSASQLAAERAEQEARETAARAALAAAGLTSGTDADNLTTVMSAILTSISTQEGVLNNEKARALRSLDNQKDTLITAIRSKIMVQLDDPAEVTLTGTAEVIAILERAGDSNSVASAAVQERIDEVATAVTDRRDELNRLANEELAALTTTVDSLVGTETIVGQITHMSVTELAALTLDISAVEHDFSNAGRPFTQIIAQQERFNTAMATQQEALRTTAEQAYADIAAQVTALEGKVATLFSSQFASDGDNLDNQQLTGTVTAKEKQVRAGRDASVIDGMINTFNQLITDRYQQLRIEADEQVAILEQETQRYLNETVSVMSEEQLATARLPEAVVTLTQEKLSKAGREHSIISSQNSLLNNAIAERRAILAGAVSDLFDTLDNNMPSILSMIASANHPALATTVYLDTTRIEQAITDAGGLPEGETRTVATYQARVTTQKAERQAALDAAADTAQEQFIAEKEALSTAMDTMSIAQLEAAQLTTTQITRDKLSHAGRTFATPQEHPVDQAVTALNERRSNLIDARNQAADSALIGLETTISELVADITNELTHVTTPALPHAAQEAAAALLTTRDAFIKASRSSTAQIDALEELIAPAIQVRQAELNTAANEALVELRAARAQVEAEITSTSDPKTVTELPTIELDTTAARTAFANAGRTDSDINVEVSIVNTTRTTQRNALLTAATQLLEEFTAQVIALVGESSTDTPGSIATMTEMELQAIVLSNQQEADEAQVLAARDPNAIDVLAQRVTDAIALRRSILTGNAQEALDELEDQADSLIEALATMFEPQVSSSALNGVDGVIAALAAAGYEQQPDGTYAQVQAQLSRVAQRVAERNQELTSSAEAALEQLRGIAEEFITTDIMQRVAAQLTQNTTLAGSVTEPVRTALVNAGLLEDPVDEIENEIARAVAQQQEDLESRARGALLELEGEVNGLITPIESMSTEQLDALALTKYQPALERYRDAGMNDQPVRDQYDRIFKPVTGRIAQQRLAIKQEDAQTAYNALVVTANAIKTHIAGLQESDRDELRQIVLPNAEQVRNKLIDAQLDASGVATLEEEIRVARQGRLDQLDLAEEARLAAEAATAQLNTFINTLIANLESALPTMSLAQVDAINTTQPTLSIDLSQAPAITALNLADMSLGSAAAHVIVALQATSQVGRVAEVNQAITRIARLQEERRLAIKQNTANAALEALQAQAAERIAQANAPETTLETLPSTTFVNAQNVRDLLTAAELTEKVGLVDTALSLVVAAVANRRANLLRDNAQVALNSLRDQVRAIRTQAQDAATLDELPSATLTGVEQAREALRGTDELDEALVDAEVTAAQNAVSEHRERIIQARIARERAEVEARVSALNIRIDEVIAALPNMTEGEATALTFEPFADLKTLMSKEELGFVDQIEPLETRFNQMLAAIEAHIAPLREERLRRESEEAERQRRNAERLAAQKHPALLMPPPPRDENAGTHQDNQALSAVQATLFVEGPFVIELGYTQPTGSATVRVDASRSRLVRGRREVAPVSMAPLRLIEEPQFYRFEYFLNRTHLLRYNTDSRAYETILEVSDEALTEETQISSLAITKADGAPHTVYNLTVSQLRTETKNSTTAGEAPDTTPTLTPTNRTEDLNGTEGETDEDTEDTTVDGATPGDGDTEETDTSTETDDRDTSTETDQETSKDTDSSNHTDNNTDDPDEQSPETTAPTTPSEDGDETTGGEVADGSTPEDGDTVQTDTTEETDTTQETDDRDTSTETDQETSEDTDSSDNTDTDDSDKQSPETTAPTTSSEDGDETTGGEVTDESTPEDSDTDQTDTTKETDTSTDTDEPAPVVPATGTLTLADGQATEPQALVDVTVNEQSGKQVIIAADGSSGLRTDLLGENGERYSVIIDRNEKPTIMFNDQTTGFNRALSFGSPDANVGDYELRKHVYVLRTSTVVDGQTTYLYIHIDKYVDGQKVASGRSSPIETAGHPQEFTLRSSNTDFPLTAEVLNVVPTPAVSEEEEEESVDVSGGVVMAPAAQQGTRSYATMARQFGTRS